MNMTAEEPREPQFASWRLSTFAGWPHKIRGWMVTPQKLADAGFFQETAEGSNDGADAVTCYVCHGTTAGWKSRQKADERHRAEHPDCPRFHYAETADAKLRSFGPDGAFWPHGADFVGPVRVLALAGWRLNATPDEPDATIADCGVEIAGWERGDSPAAEHRSRCKGTCVIADAEAEAEAEPEPEPEAPVPAEASDAGSGDPLAANETTMPERKESKKTKAQKGTRKAAVVPARRGRGNARTAIENEESDAAEPVEPGLNGGGDAAPIKDDAEADAKVAKSSRKPSRNTRAKPAATTAAAAAAEVVVVPPKVDDVPEESVKVPAAKSAKRAPRKAAIKKQQEQQQQQPAAESAADVKEAITERSTALTTEKQPGEVLPDAGDEGPAVSSSTRKPAIRAGRKRAANSRNASPAEETPAGSPAPPVESGAGDAGASSRNSVVKSATSEAKRVRLAAPVLAPPESPGRAVSPPHQITAPAAATAAVSSAKETPQRPVEAEKENSTVENKVTSAMFPAVTEEDMGSTVEKWLLRQVDAQAEKLKAAFDAKIRRTRVL